MLNISIFAFYFLLSILLASPSSALVVPPNVLEVSQIEGEGKYTKIQDAIDAIAKQTLPQPIFIKAGIYNEQVNIPLMSGPVRIYGETKDPTTYKLNTVTITGGLGAEGGRPKEETPAVIATANDLRIYNINIENTRGKGCPALALSAKGYRQGYYGVKLMGYQDTLYTNTGTQVFANSYIDGVCDFIFGQYGRAWFQNIDIRIKANGYITANGRDTPQNQAYYVFNKCDIRAANSSVATKGGSYLGRPWRQYASVVFQQTYISDLISPAGWLNWTPDSPLGNVFYREYKNTGPGAAGPRATFSRQLDQKWELKTYFGTTDWVDKDYFH